MKNETLTGYSLTQIYWEYAFENPSKCKPIHAALFFYILHLWNKLGNKKQFGLPTIMTMESTGISSRNTYYKTLSDLEDFGLIKTITSSINQHQSRVISFGEIASKENGFLNSAISKNEQALYQAPYQANEQAPYQAPLHIDKLLTNNEELSKKPKSKRFNPPTQQQVQDEFLLKGLDEKTSYFEAQKFWNHYESKGWMVGKSKMKNWKSAVAGWVTRMKQNGQKLETKKVSTLWG